MSWAHPPSTAFEKRRGPRSPFLISHQGRLVPFDRLFVDPSITFSFQGAPTMPKPLPPPLEHIPDDVLAKHPEFVPAPATVPSCSSRPGRCWISRAAIP